MTSLKRQCERALARAATELWPAVELPRLTVEETHEKHFGDYASNAAMQLAPLLKDSPMAIGEQLTSIVRWPAAVRKVFVVAPGFLNIFLNPDWLTRQPAAILADPGYGKSDLGRGNRVNLEFISANPTGPLHIGNGRGGFTGDVLANVLTTAGFKVVREYYINDRGSQVDILAESVTRAYFMAQGINVGMPEYCYRGEYVRDLVRKLNLSRSKLTNVDHLKRRVRERALRAMLRDIRATVEKRMAIRFHRWFSEVAMHARGTPKKALMRLEAKGVLYDAAGARWMRTSAFGDDKDRVLIRSNGEETYFLSDVAYLYDKFFVRQFDRAVLILGADHHGYVSRLQAALRAFGVDPARLTVILVQLVRLVENGQEVRMSKRAGTFTTIDELLAEVGPDAARFFFLMHAPGTHMDFDLRLAKTKSDENPVYYVQYAHARICSILRNVRKIGPKAFRPQRLTEPEAFDLVRLLLRFPDLIEACATDLTVQPLTAYARDLATQFHLFYTKHRIIDEGIVRTGRLDLVRATKQVLAATLKLLGIAAPEKM